MAIGLALAAASTIIGAIGSNKAAKAQEAAAAADRALQEKIYNETTQRFQPWYQGGQNALSAYMYEIGLGPKPSFGGTPQQVNEFSETIKGTGQPPSHGNMGGMVRDPEHPEMWIYPGSQDQQRTGYRVGDQVFYDRAAADEYAQANPTGATPYQGFEATPWQQNVLQTGQQAIDASASVRGGLQSGATMKRLSDYGQTTGNAFYGDYLNRLAGQSAQGQGAAGNIANAGANYGQMASNAFAAGGNAQAAGAVGVSNALNQGLGNIYGALNYQSLQNPTTQPGGNQNPFTSKWQGIW